jgi:hypothetical protein
MKRGRQEAFESLRRVTTLVLAVVAVAGLSGLIWAFWISRYDPVLTQVVVSNFAAIVGLPLAAVTAFIVVAILRQSEQPLEFEGLGFKFRGPAGEIVLWVGCFLAIVGAIRLLWRG